MSDEQPSPNGLETPWYKNPLVSARLAWLEDERPVLLSELLKSGELVNHLRRIASEGDKALQRAVENKQPMDQVLQNLQAFASPPRDWGEPRQVCRLSREQCAQLEAIKKELDL